LARNHSDMSASFSSGYRTATRSIFFGAGPSWAAGGESATSGVGWSGGEGTGSGLAAGAAAGATLAAAAGSAAGASAGAAVESSSEEMGGGATTLLFLFTGTDFLGGIVQDDADDNVDACSTMSEDRMILNQIKIVYIPPRGIRVYLETDTCHDGGISLNYFLRRRIVFQDIPVSPLTIKPTQKLHGRMAL
jgi:hypothetical protein